MNFLSLIFLVFFILSFLIYWNLPRRMRVGFLIAASLFYYGFYSPAFLLHFLIVIAVNFFLAVKIAESRNRSLAGTAVTLNILHLVFFKYFNSALAMIAPAVGIADPGTFKVVMPLAISFYTFQFIAFQVDCLRGLVTKPEGGKFFLFMLFFPHLISGPILRSGDFYGQVGNEVESKEGQTRGLYLVALGLIKKLFIADVLGYLINPVFKAPADYGSGDALLAIFGYAAQIYCDFSGFIDIARGMARLFGYDMPVNFRSPYFSTSFSELWTRWHITLSAFIREYIYFPLGGNRVGVGRQYFNLFVAMVLSGIWHGETANFLIWGVLHGLYLCIEKILKVGKQPANRFWWLVRNIWVVAGWSFAFVFFRASDFKSAVTLLGQVFVWKNITLAFPLILALIVLTWIVQYLEMRRDALLAFILPRRAVFLPAVLVLIWFLISRVQIPNEAFIYVQF
ncbi:MAG: MBOAT family protein [Turneriella sp.]|nr:MBOAT family protein [Turneriella sp.]